MTTPEVVKGACSAALLSGGARDRDPPPRHERLTEARSHRELPCAADAEAACGCVDWYQYSQGPPDAGRPPPRSVPWTGSFGHDTPPPP